jgi:hypothetical protein
MKRFTVVSGNLQRFKFCSLQYIFFLCIGVTWEDLSNPSPFNILAIQHLNENKSLFDWSRRVYLIMVRRSATAALIDQEVRKSLFDLPRGKEELIYCSGENEQLI